MPGTVEIIDVEPHELAHSDASRVQQFEHRGVPQPLGIGDRIRVQCLLAVRPFGLSGRLQQSDSLSLGQHTGQQSLGLGRGQLQAGVGSEPASPSAERGEHASGRRASCDRRPRLACRGELGEPTPEHPDVEVGNIGATHPSSMIEQPADVGDVRANRVLG